jgi:hypothetical protein
MYIDDDFEWDEPKNLSNQEDHGFSFEEAKLIWDGYVAVHQDKRHHEPRFIALGFFDARTVLFVVYTLRGKKKRIISAREATDHERQRFIARLQSRRRR